MLGNPLNFSQSALNRGAEIFARYQNQYRFNQFDNKFIDGGSASNIDENGNKKNMLNIEANAAGSKKGKLADMRKIDKIAENLRSASNSKGMVESMHQSAQGHHQANARTSQHSSAGAPLILKSPPFGSLSHRFGSVATGDELPMKSPAECMSALMESQQTPPPPFHQNEPPPPTSVDTNFLDKSLAAATAAALTPKPSNSKLYATCFICHKQLSNQYNLRVHLETHQNVR